MCVVAATIFTAMLLILSEASSTASLDDDSAYALTSS